MKWSTDLSIGVEIIDNQHMELFARINALVDAIKQHTCKHKIRDVVRFLDDYIVLHFGEEEKMMLQSGYPGYAAHKAQHTKFIANFEALKKELLKLEGG